MYALAAAARIAILPLAGTGSVHRPRDTFRHDPGARLRSVDGHLHHVAAGEAMKTSMSDAEAAERTLFPDEGHEPATDRVQPRRISRPVHIGRIGSSDGVTVRYAKGMGRPRGGRRSARGTRAADWRKSEWRNNGNGASRCGKSAGCGLAIGLGGIGPGIGIGSSGSRRNGGHWPQP